MPHVVYFVPCIACPWPGCGYQIEMIDFQLEKAGNPPLYALVMTSWGHVPDFGLVARCPGCGRHVLFRRTDKQPVSDPGATGMPVLPDDWHLHAFIA